MLLTVLNLLVQQKTFVTNKCKGEVVEDNEETKTTPPMEMKNGKNGNTKPPPKIQVDPESKNLYKELPDEDF